MHELDLTPRPYLQRSRAHAAMQRWVFAVIACGVLAAALIALEATRGVDTSVARAEERLTQAQARLVQSQADAVTITAQIKQHERELQAEEHLTGQPDWSGVMRLVAGQFDNQLMMTGFRLGDVRDSNVRGALASLGPQLPDGSVWLIVEGIAQENGGVPGLMLRLEQLGLFERVVMTGTQRQLFAGDARTSFTLACRVE